MLRTDHFSGNVGKISVSWLLRRKGTVPLLSSRKLGENLKDSWGFSCQVRFYLSEPKLVHPLSFLNLCGAMSCRCSVKVRLLNLYPSFSVEGKCSWVSRRKRREPREMTRLCAMWWVQPEVTHSPQCQLLLTILWLMYSKIFCLTKHNLSFQICAPEPIYQNTITAPDKQIKNWPGIWKGECPRLCNWWFLDYQRASLYYPLAWRIHLIPKVTKRNLITEADIKVQ